MSIDPYCKDQDLKSRAIVARMKHYDSMPKELRDRDKYDAYGRTNEDTFKRVKPKRRPQR